MKTIRIAVNGLGRIGRAFVKAAKSRQELELVVANDLGDIENFAYLLKHDSVYGTSPFDVSFDRDKGVLIVDGIEIKYLSEKDPANLPWKALDIDVVVESTGFFTSAEKAQAHMNAGAKRVVISAPVKDAPDAAIRGETVLMGLNENKLETCLISSNASCTTNASSPVIAIMDETLGIEKAILNTVHAYTASQSLVDGPSKKDPREGRAAAMNIVPSSTGAAIAVTKAITQLDGRFDGISLRVPVVCGSIADVTFISKRETSADEVNNLLRKAANEPRWSGIFAVSDEPLVSRDIIGETHASIADLAMTRVVGGNLVKILAWYDNEMGYTHTLVEHVIKAGRLV